MDLVNMATRSDVLIKELNKINKKDLINLLVLKKVPANMSLNKVLSEFFKNLISISVCSEKSEDACYYDSSEVMNSECEKIKGIILSIENEAFRNEKRLQKTIFFYLEKRIND